MPLSMQCLCATRGRKKALGGGIKEYTGEREKRFVGDKNGEESKMVIESG